MSPQRGQAVLQSLANNNEGSIEHIHLVVGATKQAFRVCVRYITEPAYMTIDPYSCLTDGFFVPYVESDRSSGFA